MADATVVYVDRGVSSGMRYGIAAAKSTGKPIEYRTLTNNELIASITPVALQL